MVVLPQSSDPTTITQGPGESVASAALRRCSSSSWYCSTPSIGVSCAVYWCEKVPSASSAQPCHVKTASFTPEKV